MFQLSSIPSLTTLDLNTIWSIMTGTVSQFSTAQMSPTSVLVEPNSRTTLTSKNWFPRALLMAPHGLSQMGDGKNAWKVSLLILALCFSAIKDLMFL